MQSWWNKKVEDLSKGMSQKLQFVITVLHEPKLIILDEPFSGLDPVNSNLIKDEIFKLAKRGSTVIFSTHRMEQVEEICDHIVLVNKGQKILDGTVSQVKNNFKENLFSIGFEEMPAAINASSFEIVATKEKSLVVKIREGNKSNDVLNHFLDNGAHVLSFNEILPSLNDIFIKLVEGTPHSRQFLNKDSLSKTVTA
jgi:ABC-2 type transport system ATP-binding protein